MTKMQAAKQGNAMNSADFNIEAATPRYTYTRSPVHERAFMILKYPAEGLNEPVAVGDYTVLDGAEDPALSEKKVMNIVTLLNGRKQLMQLGHETNSRILYRIVSDFDDDGKMRVIFYHLGQEGVSIENALLRIEKDENVT